MKINFKYLFICTLFALFCFMSCQDEVTDITTSNDQETIVPNSTLANLMSRTTANFGAADDVLDGASCFSVALPVTIVINEASILIETLDDLQQLENMYNNTSVEHLFEFVFPISIVFSDYSQITIQNEEELQSFVNACEEAENESIGCVDFVYPVSFSVFNSAFNLIDTVVIENDQALYSFLNGAEDDENAVIVSLNFPVILEYTNGDTIEVNTNEELVDAIESAAEDCIDENAVFDCFGDFEIVECEQPNNVPVFNLNAGTIALVDCIESFTPSFHETLIEAENNTNAIENSEAYATLVAQVYLRIETDNGNYQIFNVYLHTISCESPFECFGSFDAVLEVCEEASDGLYEFNLPNVFANCTPSADVVTYHETIPDADAGLNPIAEPSEYQTADLASVIYARVEIQNEYEIFPIQLNVVTCNAGDCSEGDVVGILTECLWNISIYNGSDNLSNYNFHFEQNSGIVVIYTDTITIDATWSTSQEDNGIVIAFSNVAGPNIQAINGNWLVVECAGSQLVLHNTNDSSIEIVLDRTCE